MKKKTIQCRISGFNRKGFGTGTAEDKKIAVPFARPGDQVETTLQKKKSGVYHGTLDQVIECSKERIDPRCKHFAACGGCMWQHTTYEQQLQFKEAMVRDLLVPAASPGTEWKPILPCKTPWEYRNKMEFSFSSDAKGERYLGLILQGSKGKVFNLTECHLVHSWVVDALEVTRNWWSEHRLEAYHPYRNTGSLRTLITREGFRTADRMVMLTVSGVPEYAIKKEALDDFVHKIKNACGEVSIFLRIQQAIKGKPTQFYIIHLAGKESLEEKMTIDNRALTFKVSPAAFFQPNTIQAERLYQEVMNNAQIPENGIVYDLYCGTGTMGICAASRSRHVYGVELCLDSVVDARENAKENGIENITIVCGDVGKVLGDSNYPKPDVILVDPPRSGLDKKAIETILAAGAPTIVYVSCNPATQAENIKEFVANQYQLVCVQPVDQFPQTAHVENIALLKKVAE